MNFEGIGEPVCIITDGKDDKKKNKPILFVTDKEHEVTRPFTELSLDKEEQRFQLIPNTEKERMVLYITGQSGSGKSYFTRKYCDEYIRIFPKNPIYLFSSIDKDKSIDSIKGLRRFKIKSDEFIKEEFSIEDFKDCLVIFDDIDVIPDKKLRVKVNTILQMILQTGRHTNTYCIYTSHKPCNGRETTHILNESHSITFFPQTLGGRDLNYLCYNYLGLSNHEIERILDLNSRSITVLKTYPKIILGEKDILISNNRKKK